MQLQPPCELANRKKSKVVRILINSRGELSPVAGLTDIPEQDIWLAEQKSKRTCRAYKLDVEHFMRTLRIRSYTELRTLDHKGLSNTPPPRREASLVNWLECLTGRRWVQC